MPAFPNVQNGLPNVAERQFCKKFYLPVTFESTQSLTGNKLRIMKAKLLIALSMIISLPMIAQEEEKENLPDTTRVNMGKKEIIIVSHDEDLDENDFKIKDGDTVIVKRKKKSEAHWAGVDFGFSMLMNSDFENKFPNNPYWQNDPARSQTWNLNLLEHKFRFGTPYVGLTTGLGFSFTSIAFKNNYILTETPDTLYAVIDTVNTYSKNKLKASYLTVPLLLEFNTNEYSNKSFYLAAGVVGGVRLTSKVKRNGEFDGKEFQQKDKGRYGLNPFKLDALVRFGYSDFGVFASYSLLPLFDKGLTQDMYPLTFGLSLNF